MLSLFPVFSAMALEKGVEPNQDLLKKNIEVSNNLSLKELFAIIEAKTDLKFSYKTADLPLEQEINLRGVTRTVDAVLRSISSRTRLKFSHLGSQIVVEKAMATPQTQQAKREPKGIISGQIVDKITGKRLFGANVYLKEKLLGAATDINGKFKIADVPAATYDVIVSYMGYAPVERSIKVTGNKTVYFDVAMERTLINLDQVVVTASVSETKLRESPNPMTIITSQELEYRDIASLDDILSTVPGVFSGVNNNSMSSQVGREDGSGFEGLNLRGFSGQDVFIEQSTVKVIMDGVEVVPDVLKYMDPAQIEKIEVIRGPMATTLYGAGSSGGVIQIFTKKGQGRAKLTFRAKTTSHESDYQDSNPLNSEYSFNASGGSSSLNYNFGVNYSLYPADRFEENNGVDESNWAYHAALSGNTKDIEVDVKLQHTRNKSGMASSQLWYRLAKEKGWNNADWLINSFRDNQRHSESFLGSLNLTHILSPSLYHTLIANTTQIAMDNISHTPFNYMGSEGYDRIENSNKMVNAKYFFNWKRKGQSTFKIDLTGGIDFSRTVSGMNRNIYTQVFDNTKTNYTNTDYAGVSDYNAFDNTAFFAQSVLGLGENLTLTAGFRSEKSSAYGEDVGWVNMPRVGLAYVAEFNSLSIKPRLSYGKSSEAPDPSMRQEIIAIYPWFTEIQVANPGLKPQIQKGFEVGSDFYISHFFTMGITYYNQQVENLINTETIENPEYDRAYRWVNYKDVKNSGWEFNMSALFSRFKATTAYSIINSKFGDEFLSKEEAMAGSPYTAFQYAGGRVPYIPASNFTANITYSLPAFLGWTKKGGSLTIEFVQIGSEVASSMVEYQYRMVTDNYDPVPYEEHDGFVRWNMRGDMAVHNNVVLFFDILNLTNNQDLSWNGPLRGRTITVGINTNL